MSTPAVTPTPAPAEPSFSVLREMLDGKGPAAAQTPEPKPQPSEAPGAQPAVEPEKKQAAPEAANPNQEPEKPQQPAAQQPKPRARGIERRFHDLTSEIRDLKAQLAQKNAPGEPQGKSGAASPEAQKPPEGRPVPPDPAKWTGTYDELQAAQAKYTSDLVTYEVAEALKASQQTQAQQRHQERQQTIHQSWEQRAAKVLEQNEDFQDAIDELGPVITRLGVADVIKESEVGPQMLLHLHQHPEEAQRIAQLGSPVAIARELGRLEAKLSTPPATPAAAATPLPKPPAVVGGGGVPSPVNLDTCDMDTFKREAGKLLKR